MWECGGRWEGGSVVVGECVGVWWEDVSVVVGECVGG